MGKIGFGSSDNGDSVKQTNSLETLSRILQEVEAESRQLEQDLKAEIQDIHHLRENITILEGQVLEAEKYLQTRRQLIQQALAMEASPNLEIAVAKDLLNRISHLDQIIVKKINLVNSEARKYILNEAAQILTKNVHNQQQVAAIDELARKVLASVMIIYAELNAHAESLKRFEGLVAVRENLPKAKARREVGF